MPDHIVNLREDVPGTTVVSTSNSENGRGNLYGNNGNRRIIGGLLVAINCGELLDTITGVFTKLLDAIAGIPIKLLDTITGIFIRLLDALVSFRSHSHLTLPSPRIPFCALFNRRDLHARCSPLT